jgi:hypothetical protein
MQKKALQGAIDENEILFEENEYNAEMISLLGGSGKKLKNKIEDRGYEWIYKSCELEKKQYPSTFKEKYN